MRRLTESDFPFDVTLLRWRPSGDCTCSVCPAHVQQRPPAVS